MFGPKTAAAVRGVQSCSGIAVDGIVGPNTWRYLNTPKRSCGN
jgi:peptidoglycan hydrolase-like protein with peptidoglycan-binding domain